jgi:hypothetical protein
MKVERRGSWAEIAVIIWLSRSLDVFGLWSAHTSGVAGRHGCGPALRNVLLTAVRPSSVVRMN